MRTKKGDAMAIVQLEDWEGIVEVLMFPDTLCKVQRLLEADAALIVKQLDNDEASMKILATDVYPMETGKKILSRTVTIQINAATCPRIGRRFNPSSTAKGHGNRLRAELTLENRDRLCAA
jgi:DNA polymerase III alpha subunit